MTRLSVRFLPFLFASSLLGCGSVFFADVEEPEICKTMPADFPAAPSTGTTSQSTSTELDVHDVFSNLKTLDYTGEFTLTYVRIEANQGITQFTFADSVDVGVVGTTDPSCSAPGLIAYRRGSAASAESPLTLEPSSSVNLMSCLSAGKVAIQTTFTGQLPTAPWSVTVKACFRANAKINYLNRK